MPRTGVSTSVVVLRRFKETRVSATSTSGERPLLACNRGT